MHMEKLALHNFRNYKALTLALDRNLNIFLGANAQGKTNLLESIVFVASGRSFRTQRETELIRWEAKICQVTTLVTQRKSTERLQVGLTRQPAKKSYFYGGKAVKRSQYLGRLLTVLFTPEDLAIIKGAPQERRNFLDGLISKVSPVYEYELQRYGQILRQKNQLLRTYGEKIFASPELASWNEQLARQGAKIITRRLFVLRRLNLLARLAHRCLTQGEENLELVYQSAVFLPEKSKETEIEAALLAAIKEKNKQETKVKQALVGPHRDDLLPEINGINSRLYASQGQQRTAVLALKLAEMEYLKGESGEFPLLLLDDVFSELDELRRKSLVEAIDGRVQTFITGTSAENLGSYLPTGKFFYIHRGEVKPYAPHQ